MIALSDPLFHCILGAVLSVVTFYLISLVCTDPVYTPERKTYLKHVSYRNTFFGMFIAVGLMLLPILFLIRGDYLTLMLVIPMLASLVTLLARIIYAAKKHTEHLVIVLSAQSFGALLIYTIVNNLIYFI